MAFCVGCCQGQNATYRQIHLNPPALINFKALADSQLLHPPGKNKVFIEQGEDKFEYFKRRPAQIEPGAPVFQVPPSSGQRSLLNSSPPVLSFDAIQDYGVLIPPDIQGAAGNTYLMETTNQEFDIYTKTGSMVGAVSLTNFFSAAHGARFFDPHVVYDAAHSRYIVCSDGLVGSGDGGLFVGVSLTPDPTGNWYIYAFDAAGNDSDFIDYPEIGFNNKWVVLTANDYLANDTVLNGTIYVLRADSLYAGNLGTVTEFIDTASYSLVPAQTNDTTQTGIYLVHDADGNRGGSGYMQIGTITGPVGAPVYNFGHSIGVNQPWSENPVKAVQDGGDNTIEDGDTRIMNGVTYAAGSLWFTHSVFLPADSPTHTAVDWWQIDPAALTVQQFGRIEDPSLNTFYYYPSLAVNAKNDMVLGYCISSNTYYPSSAYSFRFASDPVNTLRNTFTYHFGKGSYDKTFGGGRNRWGDFTGTAVDPVDSSFWNFNQYSGIDNSWATAIAHIADSTTACKTHADFIYTGGLSCGAPYSVNFTNLSTSATNSYWDFGDGTSSYTLNPSHSYNGSGTYSVSLKVTDPICGADSIQQNNIIHITDEDPVVTNSPSVCAGVSAGLYATGPGVIYWYNSLIAISPLDTGTSFTTPPVTDTSVFYAQSHIPGPASNCGPVDHNFGTGTYINTGRQHLIVFDCKYPQVLQSVDVYAHDSAYYNIVLLSPNNALLGSVNPYLLPGLNTVTLNFYISVDHDLKLTTRGNINLFYDSAGATYPYYSTDSTIVLLHSDQVTTTDYFYFYNWKLQTACLSNKIPAQVNVINPKTGFDYENVTGNKISFIPANGNASTSHWLFGDGTTSTQNVTSHTYASPGIYPVQLIEQVEGCTDTILQSIAVDTGNTNILTEVQSMFIYPDPVQNQLNLQTGLKQSGIFTLLVRDALGQTVLSKQVQINQGVSNYALDVSELATGIYFISLRNGKTIATRRFVKDN